MKLPTASMIGVVLVALSAGCTAKREEPPEPAAKAAANPIPNQVPQSQLRSTNVPASQLQEIERILSEFNAVKLPDGLILSIPADVLFDFDKAAVRADAASALQSIAKVVQHYSGVPVRILGHTDSKGDDAYNLRLSEARASAVRDWLAAKHAVDAARLTTAGLGETKPAVSNTTPGGADDPAGRQKNRRVEVVIEVK